MKIEGLWDGTSSGLSSLSEKTWKPYHSQMQLQGQNFLHSYLKKVLVSSDSPVLNERKDICAFDNS